jgi:chorismate mutase
MKLRALPLALLLACASAPPRAASEPAVQPLLSHIDARLAIAHDVARFKWAQHKPVDDPAREAALLDDVRTKATQRRVDPELAAAFFRAQMEAGKTLQRRDLARWESTPPAGEPTDLAVLRTRLDALSDALLDDLAALPLPLSASDCEATKARARALATPGLDDAQRDQVVSPLCAPAGARP